MELGLVYLAFAIPAIKKRARPLAGGGLLAFAWSYPLPDNVRYAVSLLGITLLLLGWPFEKQPVRFWERVTNAAIGGTALLMAVGAYNARSEVAVLGLLTPLLLLKNRVTSSAGLLPASALFLLGEYGMAYEYRLAIWGLTLVYSAHHLRKLLR